MPIEALFICLRLPPTHPAAENDFLCDTSTSANAHMQKPQIHASFFMTEIPHPCGSTSFLERHHSSLREESSGHRQVGS